MKYQMTYLIDIWKRDLNIGQGKVRFGANGFPGLLIIVPNGSWKES